MWSAPPICNSWCKVSTCLECLGGCCTRGFTYEDEGPFGDEAADEVLPCECLFCFVEGFFVFGAMATFVGEEGVAEEWEVGVDDYVRGFGVLFYRFRVEVCD